MDLNFKTETLPAVCVACKESFEAVKVGPITQTHCDKCVAIHEDRMRLLTSRKANGPGEVKSCVPEGYKDFLDSELPTNTSRLAHAQIFTWRFSPVGVGIGGPSDLGKTYVIFELARRWQKAGKAIAVVKDQDIARMVRENSPERDRLLAECSRADIIVWDDFGLSKMTDAVEGTYNDLLEKANSRNLPILGTANYGGERTKQRWAEQMNDNSFLDDRGERIVRRFRKRCDMKILQK